MTRSPSAGFIFWLAPLYLLYLVQPILVAWQAGLPAMTYALIVSGLCVFIPIYLWLMYGATRGQSRAEALTLGAVLALLLLSIAFVHRARSGPRGYRRLPPTHALPGDRLCPRDAPSGRNRLPGRERLAVARRRGRDGTIVVAARGRHQRHPPQPCQALHRPYSRNSRRGAPHDPGRR